MPKFEINVTVKMPGLEALAKVFIVELLPRLTRIERKLNLVLRLEEKQVATNAEILQEIEEQQTVADAILVAMERMANENDPAARQKILDELRQNRDILNAAALKGTPQEPPPA